MVLRSILLKRYSSHGRRCWQQGLTLLWRLWVVRILRSGCTGGRSGGWGVWAGATHGWSLGTIVTVVMPRSLLSLVSCRWHTGASHPGTGRFCKHVPTVVYVPFLILLLVKITREKCYSRECFLSIQKVLSALGSKMDFYFVRGLFGSLNQVLVW